jgi:cytochrome d ubiquinol oxidase subunit II
MFAFPFLAILAVANITRQISKRKYRNAFISSAFVSAMLMVLVAVGLFPNIVISTLNPSYHITVYNGSSTTKTLNILLTIAAIGVPIIATYTTFVFWTFRGKVKLDETSY